MEVDFDSSAEEEEEQLKIVIKEVFSVLDIEQGGRLIENPLYSEDTDSSDDSEVEMRAGGTELKDEDYVYVKESPDQNNHKTKQYEEEPNNSTEADTPDHSDVRSRPSSNISDVAPNQGLPDDHDNEHGQMHDPVSEGLGPVGCLVWAKMRGYPSWPAIVVPDPVTGRSREVRSKQRGEWRHVLFLEYRNEVAWMHQDQLKVFSTKGTSKMKGRNRALVTAVELANSLSCLDYRDRIRSFTEYQQTKMEEKQMTSSKGIAVGLVWEKLSMKPVVRLKRIKLRLKPTVRLKRIKVVESEIESDDDSENNRDNSNEDPVFTNLKPFPSCLTGWCEGQLVWARVQGYPFWPAVIVREQKSDKFSIPGKAGMMKLHVMFLAYQKQHAWLWETAVVPFHSSDQFKTILASGNKKSQKEFIPSKKLASKYTRAVKVAMELLPSSLYNRLEYLYT